MLTITITKELFDALLEWLDPAREAAARKYETIRAGLIRIFISKGFADAEDLTDETFNRVSRKLPDVGEDYDAKVRYCRGVARNIMLEAWRRKEIATDRLPERPGHVATTTERYDCLLKCLKHLSEERRELILDYYLYEGRSKIDLHRRMADELGLTTGALRTRAHHIRVELEKCVSNCVRNLSVKQKASWEALLRKRQETDNTNQERQP
ncbi:MAG TPA: sigma-70 family RNA polymerase sigma factor [Pyrinomonadaceae bacterium]|nr:sigma-70 family RNA polymerase sigma factor [Pyrinomonadaceae bacterium]